MKTCPDPIEIEALVDGEAGADRAALEAHIASCPDCARIAAETRSLDTLLREAGTHRKAPPPPRERVGSRRALLVGGGAALAASVGGFALLGARDAVDPVERLAVTYFGDFQTTLAGERRLDVAGGDPARALRWFAARVPFSLPAIVQPSGVTLRGGRLCWLLDRRNVALHFDTAQGGCCLYLAGGAHNATLTADAPVLMSRDGMSGAFWQSRDVIHALVGEPPRDALADLMRGLFANARS